MASTITFSSLNKTLSCRVARTQPSRARVVSVGCTAKNTLPEQSVALSRRAAVGAGAILLAGLANPKQAMAKDKAGTYWISPSNGETVTSPFTVKMGVKNLDVVPVASGPVEGSGHHHILIDNKDGFITAGEAVPFGDGFVHYGKAQTSAELELPPGKHKLTLQFANYKHLSYGKNLSKTITVNVK